MTKTWARALAEGAWVGSAASLTSAAALAWCGREDRGSALEPINAPAHWVWGDRALDRPRPSARYTGWGFGIHHVSSVFWATLHARWLVGDAPRRMGIVVRDAALMSALAASVDLRLAPRRLRPGFERQLSPSRLAVVYAAFGVGLAVVSCALERGARRSERRRSSVERSGLPVAAKVAGREATGPRSAAP